MFRAVTGLVSATALWMIAGELGLPHIAGLSRFGALPVVALAGALIGLTRFRNVTTWITFAFVAVLAVVAYTGVIERPSARLIRRDATPASADAIVVLSAGVTMDGMLPQQGLDRLLKGIELARAGVAPRIVVTRERMRYDGKWISTADDQNRLVALSGAEVVATGLVTSTRDEAARTARMAQERGWKRIVLVTSPFHSRRACATFEEAGLAVSCVPADSRDIAVRNLVGADNRVRAFGMWVYEWAATLRYKVAGWI